VDGTSSMLSRPASGDPAQRRVVDAPARCGQGAAPPPTSVLGQSAALLLLLVVADVDDVLGEVDEVLEPEEESLLEDGEESLPADGVEELSDLRLSVR